MPDHPTPYPDSRRRIPFCSLRLCRKDAFSGRSVARTLSKSLEAGLMSASASLFVCVSEQDQYGNIPLYRAILLAAKSSNLIWVRVNKNAEVFTVRHSSTASSRSGKSTTKRTANSHSLTVQITGPESAVTQFAKQHRDLLDTASGTALLLHGCFV